MCGAASNTLILSFVGSNSPGLQLPGRMGWHMIKETKETKGRRRRRSQAQLDREKVQEAIDPEEACLWALLSVSQSADALPRAEDPMKERYLTGPYPVYVWDGLRTASKRQPREGWNATRLACGSWAGLRIGSLELKSIVAPRRPTAIDGRSGG